MKDIERTFLDFFEQYVFAIYKMWINKNFTVQTSVTKNQSFHSNLLSSGKSYAPSKVVFN